MQRKKAVFLLLLAAVLWSIAGICIKEMTWNGYAITGVRALLCGLVLLCKVKRPKIPRGAFQIGAVLSYVGVISFVVIATKLTTAANAILLEYTAPIYSGIFGYLFLKERISKKQLVCMGLIFAGLLIFFMDGISVGHFAGDLIALLSGVCYGTMTVFMRADPKIDPANHVFWGSMAGFLLMLPFIGHLDLTWKNLVLILILGVFQLGLAYVCYTTAVRYVSSMEATMITVLEPILNPIWVMLLGNEVPGMTTIISGLLVIAAILLLAVPEKRKAERSVGISGERGGMV